jgi:hypothetical protein
VAVLCRADEETALSKGSIGPARQEFIAAGLILPLAGAHKRGGDDPIAAYRIFTSITRSPEQTRMAEHRHELRKRHCQHKEDRRAALAMLNGHVYRFD